MKCFLLCLLENTEETKTTWLIIPSIFSEKVELFFNSTFHYKWPPTLPMSTLNFESQRFVILQAI